MPKDDLPSTPVESRPFINPSLDSSITSPKQRKALDDSFKSFFEGLDAAPAEPKQEPKQETATESVPSAESEPEPVVPTEPDKPKDEEPAVTAKEPPSPAPPSPAPPSAATPAVPTPPAAPVAPKEEPKVPEFESLEPHPGSSEAQKGQFAKLKEIAKNFATEAKLLRSKIAPVLSEIGLELKDSPEEMAVALETFAEKVKSLKSSAMAPEIQTELESLRQLARSVGVLQSEEFVKDYVKPVETAYLNVIEEMSKYFDADPEKIKTEFLEPLQTKFRPPQLPPEWWDEQMKLMTKAPEIIKRKIEAKVADVLRLQELHDKRAKELSEDKSSYAEWQKQNQERYSRDYESQIRDEVEKALATDKKAIAGWRPMLLDGVTDPTQRAAIEKHNARFANLEKRFANVITGFNQGPRSAARLGLEFIEMEEGAKYLADSLKAKHDEFEALKASSAEELQKAKEEIAKLKAEVTKTRKVADAVVKPTSGTAAAKPAVEKAKLPKDARGSLQDAFRKWET